MGAFLEEPGWPCGPVGEEQEEPRGPLCVDPLPALVLLEGKACSVLPWAPAGCTRLLGGQFTQRTSLGSFSRQLW